MAEMKKQYYAIDFMKCALAILLVCAHVSSEKLSFPVYIDIWFSFYIIAVPFFFTTSSYFFFKKIQNQTNKGAMTSIYIHYTKRLLKMYLAWSVIYTLFKVAQWIQTDTFSLSKFTQHIYYSIVYSSYPTIWFLPALWLSVSIVYLLLYEWSLSPKSVLVVCTILFLICWVGGTFPNDFFSFPPIRDWYLHYFKSFRNGLFYGPLLVGIGAYMAINNKFEDNKSVTKYYILSAVFMVMFVAEAFLTKQFINPKVDANYVFMLVPFTYVFVIALSKTTLQPRKLYMQCRNLSLLLFLSQRIFITAIPALLPTSIVVILTQNPYWGLCIFLGSTILFSIIIVLLTKKMPWLKILW